MYQIVHSALTTDLETEENKLVKSRAVASLIKRILMGWDLNCQIVK